MTEAFDSIEIVNLYGKKLTLDVRMINDSKLLDLSFLRDGMYQIRGVSRVGLCLSLITIKN
ncbi:hypothetical protein GCM10011318_14380 [Phaeocystidibacter marisrubri]|nr:hypothetical protein GCM10011318_14380 [Phaeocystidibacter marisrubri]